jgi:hypothetical protein
MIPMIISLCALGCYVVWVWAPDWVSAADARIIRSYAKKSEDRFNASIHKITQDRVTGTAELSALVEEWAGYRYGDRQLRLAQQALQHLVRTYVSSGDYATATQTLEKYFDLMGGDLNTRAKLYDYMSKVPTRRAEALAGLQRAHQDFPMHHQICTLLANLLASERRVGEGWDVHTTAFERSQSNIWRLTWVEMHRTNPNMYANLVPRATKDGFVLSTELPLMATELHIRPAIHAYAQYQKISVHLQWPQGQIDVPLDSGTLEGISLTNGVYRITSERPKIHFLNILNVRSALKIADHVRLKLTIECVGSPVPSPEMSKYSWRHGLALRSIASKRGDAAMTALVNTASEGAFLGLSSKLYWSGKGSDFSAKRSLSSKLVTKPIKDGGNSFTSEFNLDVTANRVRFDFPEISNTNWQISRLDLHTSKGVIALGNQTPQATPGLDLVDGFYRPIDDDPYLVYQLDEEVKLKSAYISGVVR